MITAINANFSFQFRARLALARTEFPSAAPLDSGLAKEAVPAVSSSGIRGESPLPVCTDRGALEDIFEHFEVRFLTAGESL